MLWDAECGSFGCQVDNQVVAGLANGTRQTVAATVDVRLVMVDVELIVAAVVRGRRL